MAEVFFAFLYPDLISWQVNYWGNGSFYVLCMCSHTLHSSGWTSCQENPLTKSDVKPLEYEEKQQFAECFYHCGAGKQENWARASPGSCLQLKASGVNQTKATRHSANSSSGLVLCKGAVTLKLHSHELQKSFLENKGILGFCPQTSKHLHFEGSSNQSNSRSRKRIADLWHSLFLLIVKSPLTFPTERSNAERFWAPIIFTTINSESYIPSRIWQKEFLQEKVWEGLAFDMPIRRSRCFEVKDQLIRKKHFWLFQSLMLPLTRDQSVPDLPCDGKCLVPIGNLTSEWISVNRLWKELPTILLGWEHLVCVK